MVQNQLRQSSLILGSGPGALTVLQDGTTVLIPGIDAWYVTRKPPIFPKIPDDVIIHDLLLQQNLGVDYFVLPPAEGISESLDSSHLDTILFPKWLICYSCNKLEKVNEPNRIKCTKCFDDKKISRKMVQTNFVVACEDGHLDEFPWAKWVHRGQDCTATDSILTFKAKGVVQLSSQTVICSCGKRRDLGGTSTSYENGTTELSLKLSPNQVWTCSGGQPWLLNSAIACEKHIRMVLRSSNNIYFANSVSSILVPTSSGQNTEAIERLEASNSHGKYKAWLVKNHYDFEKTAQAILVTESEYYAGIDLNELKLALAELFPSGNIVPQNNLEEISEFDRTPEWNALSRTREDKDLIVREVEKFNAIEWGLHQIHAVPLLRKTTALKGFTRLKPRDISPAHGRQLLRRNPFGANSNWLPAIRQTGEGIFISLDGARLANWVNTKQVEKRIAILNANASRNGVSESRFEVTANFVLLHTLSHILIQELVIECGYTSASLAERIYSEGVQSGLLIYTASASADGTMGGLVEMSHPRYLLKTLETSIERARWCSNDPVCMELGHIGQGNLGSNLSACHNCCLLPETACDHFNQGLDRALLVGDTTGRTDLIGFFDFL